MIGTKCTKNSCGFDSISQYIAHESTRRVWNSHENPLTNPLFLIQKQNICVIFATHPAPSTTQQRQPQSHSSQTTEQPQQQPSQTISVNPRDISSSGSVMTG